MRQFKKKLRNAEKAAKHMFKNNAYSANLTINDRDDARSFRIETAHELAKAKRVGSKIYMKKGL